MLMMPSISQFSVNKPVDRPAAVPFLTRSWLLQRPMAWCNIIEHNPLTLSVSDDLLMRSAKHFSQTFYKVSCFFFCLIFQSTSCYWVIFQIMTEESSHRISRNNHPLIDNPLPVISFSGVYELLVLLTAGLSANERLEFDFVLKRHLDGAPLAGEMQAFIKTLLSSPFFTGKSPRTDRKIATGQCWSVLTSVVLLLSI